MIDTLRPYFLLTRFDKPIGTILLLFPCWWGVVYIQKSQFSPTLLILLFLGALIMRSAGCILNDLFDQKFDKEVARTKTRPLAAGTVERRPAIMLFLVLCLAGLVILLQLPPPCWLIGLIGLLLLLIYPAMKRLTNLPQVCLGFAFNIGFLVGIVAVTGDLTSLYNLPVALIYGAAILWTVGYDTIYAVQDRVDDIRLGVRSTAVLFGSRTRQITLAIYGTSATLMLVAFILQSMSLASFALISLAYGWLGYHLWWLDLEDVAACRDFFIANQWLGSSVFLALMV
ncbi:4-hydroxybenzoate octaprenyltransferase [Candidatus Paracaedibacter symbiosus]|uniref:4-hydroxybenzoate octaprenyltransferase n=1 Tax=Candidatus Paracaedibacter symbiosus TaxID=244582 RepID=UPI000A0552AC|nr:4-hydroxybenzoate octaprenyltransferase [Candidatus Paracaedibacter symbiosus]